MCGKLKEKYGKHPLEVLAEKIDRDLDFDDESEYAGSEVGSEFNDSMLGALDDLGFSDSDSEYGDDGGRRNSYS
jgi:hypothetical protein